MPKKPTKRTRRRASSASGPVSLAEARALAALSAPVSRSAKAITPSPTPRTIGLARRDLAARQAQERQRRIREYQATLRIMKRRGVKGLKHGAAGGRTAKAAAKPLQVFAEGDSWFDYPAFIGGGIVPRLENKVGVPILNLAKAGDEVRFMLGVDERKLLINQLMKGCPAGGPWDAMLFSGGGNDVVGNPMALWIKDFSAALPPAALIHQARFAAALALVRAGYEDLIELRDRLSPGTHLFFHGYDFAIPDGRGICFLGPWLKPTFDLRGFPTQASRSAAMKILLQQFAAVLGSLAAAHSKVTFIATQGTLKPVPDSWHNELHPAKAGFDGFATMFHAALKAAFPGRVL